VTQVHRHSANPAKNSLNPTVEALCRVDPPPTRREHGFVFDAIRKRYFQQPAFLPLNFLVWCGVAAILFWVRFVIYKDLTRALVITLGADTMGFLLTCTLRQFYRRKEPSFPRGVGIIFQVASLSLLCAATQAASVQIFAEFMGWQGVNRSTGERLLLFSAAHWILYLGWSLGYFWVKAEMSARQKSQHAARAKADAQKSELQLLRFQLDPHFLFNTLNGIASEIPSNPDAAVQMVAELSSYLRYSLDHRSHLLTPLAVEIDTTNAYLKIQVARFGDKLQTSIAATPAARDVLVPSFLLQPLVENAFKHGFNHAPAPWDLVVAADVHADRLKIEIRNNGNLATYEDGDGSGLGLELIHRRLAIHYPDRHSFRIQQAQGWVVATLELEGLPCSV
jgi:two-component system LytT family sensor kinase